MSDMQKAEQCLAIIDKFIVDNEISCAETVYQSDRVIQNAYEFIHALCEVAGYAEWIDDDD